MVSILFTRVCGRLFEVGSTLPAAARAVVVVEEQLEPPRYVQTLAPDTSVRTI
jgi:hypothetical protein